MREILAGIVAVGLLWLVVGLFMLEKGVAK